MPAGGARDHESDPGHRIGIAPDDRSVPAQHQKGLSFHRADRLIDATEIGDIDADPHGAGEFAARRIDSPAEEDDRRSDGLAFQRQADMECLIIGFAHFLEEFAIGKVDARRRPLPRRVQLGAVASCDRDDGRLGQGRLPAFKKRKHLLRGGATQIRRGLDAECLEARLDLTEDDIDRLDRALRLTGEDFREPFCLAHAGGGLVRAESPRRDTDREQRERHQADHDPEQVAVDSLMARRHGINHQLDEKVVGKG